MVQDLKRRLNMVEEMLKTAKEQRRNRSLAAFIVVGIIGMFVFADLGTGLMGGALAWLAVWVAESREVCRVQRIQKPWRGE